MRARLMRLWEWALIGVALGVLVGGGVALLIWPL
jgi:hypothetical protein